jgi:tetratricopeptide (TPR) repeat protein
MECHPQLDAACGTGVECSIVLARLIRALLAAVLLSLHSISATYAQCSTGSPSDAVIDNLYSQQKWAEVVATAQRTESRSAEVNFQLGMALAHLQRWNEAEASLLAGRNACPQQKRFPTELAGVAFQRKRYSEAAHWIEKALRIDPKDEYANDFAGTVFLLMDNLNAALKYWNRVQKPQINALQLDPTLRVHRLLLERAFVFSPQAVMLREQLLATEARLNAMEVFPAYSIKLGARETSKFDAQFNAIERNGFGNGWMQSTMSIFSGLPYETLYPSYFNLGGSATNVDSLFRWDAQKRRVWLEVSGPWHALPKWRWRLAADGRDENWAIRRPSTGNAPALASFKLKREAAAATLTSIHSGRFQWALGGDISHRSYTSVTGGSLLDPELVSRGWEIKQLASAREQLLNRPEHRFQVDAFASSELARLWSSPARLFYKGQGGLEAHWYPQAEGERYEFTQRVRGGGVAGSAPLDELWMIGVERDNNLWLRAHVGTRGGKKGSAPMADRFLLSNTDFYRRIWSNGLVSIKAGPLLDVARPVVPISGLAQTRWLFDIGVQLKLSVLGTGVVLTYGHDLHGGSNAFYGSVAQR